MDRSLKWRTIALAASILLCFALLAPTWPGSSSLPSWFPFKKKINLGLDLQGGVHIVYTIALDRAVDDKASDIKRDLESRYLEEKVEAKVRTPANPVGALAVELTDASKKAEVESQIRADYGDTIEIRACGPGDGSATLCFRVSTSYAEGIKKSALANAVTTIRERIDEKGVVEPTVVEKGDDIIVELPGDPRDPLVAETREIIAQTSKLEFKVVSDGSDYMRRMWVHVAGDSSNPAAPQPDKLAADLQISAEIEQWRSEEGGGQLTDYYLHAFDREEQVPVSWARKRGCLRNDSVIENDKTTCRFTGRAILERYLFGDKDLGVRGLTETEGFKVPEDRQISFEPEYPDPRSTEKRVRWRTYYLERAVRLTGSSIANAQPSVDPDTGHPIVLLDFDRYGSRVFGDLTASIIGKKFAIVLDGKVRSAPTVNVAIRGGRAMVTMGGGDIVRQERDRDELVNVLRTGSLPAPLVEQSKSELGPTLGADAISKTQLSFIIGIVLVVLIMVGIYRWSGWISVFAVVFHIVMTLAIMAAFGATLTLPGIAAIVLSIGMEVDGNILIYERIRDELLLGKSVRGAIDLGFSRAFSAILDGQLTTAAAGWVLLQYGSGPIKGFAVMLLVGVFTTLSTNIWVTRIFFDWYVSRKKGTLATISI